MALQQHDRDEVGHNNKTSKPELNLSQKLEGFVIQAWPLLWELPGPIPVQRVLVLALLAKLA